MPAKPHPQTLTVGSVLRDDFGPESDIDVLVEFEDGHTPGMRFFGMGDDLEELLGRKVDFLTEEWLHPRFRQTVVDAAEAIYAA